MHQSVVAIKVITSGWHKFDQCSWNHILEHGCSTIAHRNRRAIGPCVADSGVSKIASGFIGHGGALIPGVSSQPCYTVGYCGAGHSWKVFVIKLFDSGSNQGRLHLIGYDISNVIAIVPREQYGRQDVLTPQCAITAECVG